MIILPFGPGPSCQPLDIIILSSLFPFILSTSFLTSIHSSIRHNTIEVLASHDIATMTTRRPNLKIPLPERQDADFQRNQTTLRSPSIRSPRFVENFDAPFSEAIMNASRTTLATDTMSFPSTEQNSRNSIGGESDRRPSLSSRQTTMPPPSPLRLRNPSWESESKRRSNVNDRIREWAKKSWGAVKTRPDTKGDYFNNQATRSQSSILMSPSNTISPSEPDGGAPVNNYIKSKISVTELAR